MLTTLLLLLACAGSDPDPDSDPVEPGFLEPPAATRPSEDVGGVRVLSVRTDMAVTVDAHIADPTGARTVFSAELTDEHSLVLVGFRSEVDTEVEVVATSADGAESRAVVTVHGDPLPEIRPDIEVLVHEPERAPKGWLLLPTTSPANLLRIDPVDLLLDADLQIVWWRRNATPLGDLRSTPRGTLAGQGFASVEEVSWTGEVLKRFVPGDAGPGETLIEGPVHHEALPLEDGTWLTLMHSTVEVDAYPQSLVPPDVVDEPARLLSSRITRFDDDGTTLESVELLDHIDPQRVSWGSLEWSLVHEAFDHSHANAVVVDGDDGGWVVSLRHQDVLLKLDADRQPLWLLGDPAGWSEPWSDLLLEPVGELTWPYHQHAPELGSEGRVLMFDNTNLDATPYTAVPAEDRPSRLVEFQVDAAAGTVEELWSFSPDLEGPLHSGAMGDADRLADGHVLGVWGFLEGEAGETNAALGRGTYSARLLVVEPEAEQPVVIDLRLSSDAAERTSGWGLYRAEFLEELPSGVSGSR